VPNADQAHSDRNFIDLTPPKANDDLTWINSDTTGDACDDDDDNDGLLDAAEAAGCNGSGPLNPLVRDSDGDRFLDFAECDLGSNPANSGATPPFTLCGLVGDADLDGLQNRTEYCFYNGNTSSTNTDGDGCGDAREVMSVNNDQVVGSADLGLVAGEFGAYPVGSYRVAFDPNKDGTIGSADLGLVAGKFGACP
jgi:hypothetical protein